jgi:hypothetical protein
MTWQVKERVKGEKDPGGFVVFHLFIIVTIRIIPQIPTYDPFDPDLLFSLFTLHSFVLNREGGGDMI